MAKKETTATALGPLGMLRWAWTQLTKMNTALFLLLMLAVAAVPGSIFPQRIQDPTKVTDYIDTHPTWGPIADKIQLFDVFSSVWFAAIYILLFISLIGCVTPRANQHINALRKKPAKTPKNLNRLPVHRTLTITSSAGVEDLSSEQAIANATAVLKKRHYSVDVQSVNGVYSVSAERGYIREIGNIIFHVAMIGVLIGVAVGSLFGYRVQKILVEGDTFVNSLISFDSFTPGTNYNPDWLDPYTVTLNKFDVEYDRQQGSHTYGDDLDYTADLSFQETDRTTDQATLKVNDPVNVNGTNLYLSGNGYAPIIKVENSDGSVAYEGPVVGLTSDGKYTSSIVLKVPDAKNGQLGFVGMFLPTGERDATTNIPRSIDSEALNPMLVLQSYTGDLGLDSGRPQNVYVLDTNTLKPLNTMATGNGIVLDAANNTVDLPEGHGKVTFEGYKRYVGLDVHYDPGKKVVLWSFIVAFCGLIISLFVPRRRVWVRAQSAGSDLMVEYGLLARGEDPRLADEADKLTDIFAARWGLEFSEADDA